MSKKKPRRQELQGELFEREERAAQKAPEVWCSECDGHFPFGTVHNCPEVSSYDLDQYFDYVLDFDDWPYDD